LRRLQHSRLSLVPVVILSLAFTVAHADTKPHLFQSPALKGDLIAFGYAGDLWTVPRNGGRRGSVDERRRPSKACRFFSPDGSTIAFTGEYDGNTDVFTIPVAGGVPHRVTYHPAPDAAVAWTPRRQADSLSFHACGSEPICTDFFRSRRRRRGGQTAAADGL